MVVLYVINYGKVFFSIIFSRLFNILCQQQLIHGAIYRTTCDNTVSAVWWIFLKYSVRTNVPLNLTSITRSNKYYLMLHTHIHIHICIIHMSILRLIHTGPFHPTLNGSLIYLGFVTVTKLFLLINGRK